MAARSKGRGSAALFGLVLLLGGLIVAGVLFAISIRRPGQAVDAFARAPVGCTTTLEFTETGTYYVYEESSTAIVVPQGGCVPAGTPDAEFAAVLTGAGGDLELRLDDSITYDVDGRVGTSFAGFDVTEVGRYEVVVVASDATLVAAIGRDPHDGVDDLQRWAWIVGGASTVLGLVILVAAGRRSKRAATFQAPTGPGWGPRAPDASTPAAPEPPRAAQVPVNPHQPPAPVAPVPAARPLPTRPTSAPGPTSPWAAPSGTPAAGERPSSGVRDDA